MNITSFDELSISNDIKQALAGLKYHTPTDVQSQVIPQALDRRDLIVRSQTGSGKTASFGIPICDMVDWEENKPQALILTPTRELATQIKEDISNIGRFKRVKAAAIYGKSPFDRQKLELKQKTHVVVGTPGRILDHIQKETLLVDKIKYLVIDEADEMLNMGFIDQVESIIQELPQERATSMFSATIPADVESLCHKYMHDPVEIEVSGTGSTTQDIEHVLYEVKKDDKFQLLKDVTVVENPDSCIVFCATQEQVNHVFSQLKLAQYSCEKIHGGLDQKDRFTVMEEFKRGKFRYLVATDLAARGIDIDNISLVINYDVPLEKESYVHRTGRTGRAGKTGKAITFATPHESKFISYIERYVGFSIPVKEAPSSSEVSRAKAAFNEKMTTQAALKKDKSAQLTKNIMKLYFNGGKKKKLRAVDFVGTLTNIDGITADDIGIITIQETVTYVDILNGKGSLVLQEMKDKTIKGKQLKVHRARQ
ncbi:RNA helicase [Salipaludibacillus keqinensis]|uniref:ATP-dependent RNA helicase DbpA n=1 Tax=Salipaludibacillus keqinensis TaxID=2045207 RepID=A0A323TA79_9BACI|nr:DEAD/DEAH box helicase [Salipaludibacillus keqinensis]PYZ92398.1 RNA helicase [Salipaludibacillus keqinensis]